MTRDLMRQDDQQSYVPTLPRRRLFVWPSVSALKQLATVATRLHQIATPCPRAWQRSLAAGYERRGPCTLRHHVGDMNGAVMFDCWIAQGKALSYILLFTRLV